MNKNVALILRLMAGACALSALSAQDIGNYTSFTADGRTIQFHGFVSEGFGYSNDNNYLTMNTSQGSFFTDGGVNVSSQISDKFRVGAQIYDRDIGQLGKWHPTLDWAVADYRFSDWFGIRAGKVKTVLGLFNDTQDMEFLQTWALMPQAIYPLDLRTSNLAHTGGDIYGTIPLRAAGSLAYTGYFGLEPDDKTSGWYYSNNDIGYPIHRIYGRMWGMDLRWTTAVPNLKAGLSLARKREHWDGWLPSENNGPYIYVTPDQWTGVAYADYQPGKWHFSAEYMRNHNDGWTWNDGPPWWLYNYGYMGWYVAGAYRLNPHVEVGAYNSQYEFLGFPATDHLFDRVATVRFDLTSRWDLKVEGHFMTGTGGAEEGAAHGFYLFDNPTLQPTTRMLIVRTGWNF
jgi:hypothetical protein